VETITHKSVEIKMSKKISQKLVKGDHNTLVAGDMNINIDITGEIDNAATFIKEGKAEGAINLLERLWQKYSDKMTAREKYRTQANIGHAYNLLEKFEETAKYWFRAVQFDPDYEEAQSRQAWAYYQQGNIVKAREIAGKVLKKYPETIMARTVIIASTPDDISLDEIEKNIPGHQKNEPTILMALAHVTSSRKDFDKAEKYIAEALRASENDPGIKEQLGRLLIQKTDLWKYALTEKIPTTDEKATIATAIELIEGACNEWIKQNNIKRLVQARLLLASAYRAVGNKEDSENNIRVAFELDNTNEHAACEYASLIANNGEQNRAIDILGPLSQSPEQLAIVDLYAQILFNRA